MASTFKPLRCGKLCSSRKTAQEMRADPTRAGDWRLGVHLNLCKRSHVTVQDINRSMLNYHCNLQSELDPDLPTLFVFPVYLTPGTVFIIRLLFSKYQIEMLENGKWLLYCLNCYKLKIVTTNTVGHIYLS